MGEPSDHLMSEKAISSSHVFSAAALAERLGLLFAPGEAQPGGDGDAVNKECVVLVERQAVEARADRVVVGLAVASCRRKCRVRASQEARKIAALLPGLRAQRIARPIPDGEIAAFVIDEQRWLGGDRIQQARLAD